MITNEYLALEDNQKIRHIIQEIRAINKAFAEKYPILQKQNFIGFSFFFISITAIILSLIGYINGAVNEWFLLFWVAFWTSILHELEHDLIHFMYFKKNKVLHNIMMLGVWLFRPLTINPWMRRTIHFHHHKVSGTITDIEERGLGNGEKWSFRRLLTTADIFLGGILRVKTMIKELNLAKRSGEITPEQRREFKKINTYSMQPFTMLCYFTLYTFIFIHIIYFAGSIFGIELNSLLQGFVDSIWVKTLVFGLLIPNLFRMFCLHFITSNLHYYGDIEAGNIVQQTQVLNKWYFIPFQFFCFNFGSTHAIHHFVVNETFYNRQLTASKAHKVLKKYGVRFNDLGTFKRANRYEM